MSTSKADTEILPTGAYIIQVKGTSNVVHMDNDRAIIAPLHDHNNREQQIWWIESLPYDQNHLDAQSKGLLCTITNIKEDRRLDLCNGLSNNGADVIVSTRHGLPWQKWIIEEVEDPKIGHYYTISNFYSGTMLDYEDAGGKCYGWERNPTYDKQHWELLVPLVAVPPGWIQIQSLSTEFLENESIPYFLQQNYPTSSPFLGRHPAPSRPSCYRETWGTQWAFIHPQGHGGESPHNRWIIMNRLTRGLLECRALERCRDGARELPKNLKVDAIQSPMDDKLHRQWRVDATPSGKWKIKSMHVPYPLMISTELLGDDCAHDSKNKRYPITPSENGDCNYYSVTCSSLGFFSSCDKETSWIFTSANHRTLPVAAPPPARESQGKEKSDN